MGRMLKYLIAITMMILPFAGYSQFSGFAFQPYTAAAGVQPPWNPSTAINSTQRYLAWNTSTGEYWYWNVAANPDVWAKMGWNFQGSLAQYQVAYGSAANTITGSADFVYEYNQVTLTKADTVTGILGGISIFNKNTSALNNTRNQIAFGQGEAPNASIGSRRKSGNPSIPSTELTFATSDAAGLKQRMIISSGGNVGIGTDAANSTSRLVIKNTQEPGRSLAIGRQTFDNTTDWTLPANVSITGGVLSASNATGTVTFTGTFNKTLKPESAFEVTYRMPAYSSGTCTLAIGDATYPLPGVIFSAAYPGGNVVVLIPATAINANTTFQITMAGFTGTFDDIFVYEISQPVPFILSGQNDNDTTNYNILVAHNDMQAVGIGGGARYVAKRNANELNNSGQTTSDGNANFSLGTNALINTTWGRVNNAVGNAALRRNTIGINNVANGNAVLSNNTIGSGNVGVGTNSLFTNISGGNNVGIGGTTLFSAFNISGNVAIGNQAFRGLRGGGNSIAIGTNAGLFGVDGTTTEDSLLRATSSIYLGFSARGSRIRNSTATISNEIVIGSSLTTGSDIIGGGNNSVVLGNTAIAKTILRPNVMITNTSTPHTTTPLYPLHVVGNAYVEGASAQFLAGSANASASTPAYSFHRDKNTGMYQSDTSSLAFAVDGIQSMYLNNSGNVGIGTNNALYRLNVVKDNAADGISVNAGGNTASYSPFLTFGRHRGTISSRTSTSSGDNLGYLSFHGVNSSNNYNESGRIQFVQDAAATTQVRSKFEINVNNGTELVNRFSISSAGLINLNGGVDLATSATITGSYTATNSDCVLVCNSSTPFTLTLPSTPPTGQLYFITRTNSTGNLTISANGQTINGNSSITLSTQYESVRLIYTGTEWIRF